VTEATVEATAAETTSMETAMEATSMEPATTEAAHAGGGRGWCECKADKGRCQDRD